MTRVVFITPSSEPFLAPQPFRRQLEVSEGNVKPIFGMSVFKVFSVAISWVRVWSEDRYFLCVTEKTLRL